MTAAAAHPARMRATARSRSPGLGSRSSTAPVPAWRVPEQTHAVPIVHAPAAGPVVARLVLGVGTCDEPVTVAGVAHLVEHLVVRAALPIAAPHNAVTQDWVTAFEIVAATTEDALGHIRRFADAVQAVLDTSEETVERERRILAREDRLRYDEMVPSVHTARFGPAGPGRSGAGAAPVAGVTPAEVREWVEQHLVAGNAIVTLAGGTLPSATVDLALPPGPPAAPMPSWTGPMRTAALVESPLGGLAASVVVPDHVAPLLEAVLEHEVFDALRMDAGLAYAVDSHSVALDPERTVVVVTADADEADTEAAATIVVETLRRLASSGPDATTIARVDAARAVNAADEVFRADVTVTAAALTHLRGLPAPPPADGPVTQHELDDLRGALRDALGTLVLCVDQDADDDFAALAARHGLAHVDGSAGEPAPERVWFPPRPGAGRSVHRTALLPAFADAHLEIVDTRITLRVRGRPSRMIDLAEAAVVGRRGDLGVTVVDGTGNTMQLRADEWWRGRRTVAAVVRATPPHLLRDFSY